MFVLKACRGRGSAAVKWSHIAPGRSAAAPWYRRWPEWLQKTKSKSKQIRLSIRYKFISCFLARAQFSSMSAKKVSVDWPQAVQPSMYQNIKTHWSIHEIWTYCNSNQWPQIAYQEWARRSRWEWTGPRRCSQACSKLRSGCCACPPTAMRLNEKEKIRPNECVRVCLPWSAGMEILMNRC